MKIKKLLAVGAVAAATVATLRIAQRYNTWKQEEVARLQSNSSLIETALGTVEYKMIGQGPAVLVAHGSPGGYDQGIAFARLIGSDHGEVYGNYDLFVEGTTIVMRRLVDALPQWIMLSSQAI